MKSWHTPGLCYNKHTQTRKASKQTHGGVGHSAPEGTLSVRRASVLGAVDHNLSVDPCGSGARR